MSKSRLGSPTFVSPKTALLVIDSLSTVFDDVYRQDRGSGKQQQRQQTHPTSSSAHGAHNLNNTNATNTASKPFQPYSQGRNLVLSDLIARLSSLAALHNVAVVYTSQTATRLVRHGAGGVGGAAADASFVEMSGGGGGGGRMSAGVAAAAAPPPPPPTSALPSVPSAPVPTLCPVLGSGSNAEWHASVAVRIVLFRNWVDGYVYARKGNTGRDEKIALRSAARVDGQEWDGREEPEPEQGLGEADEQDKSKQEAGGGQAAGSSDALPSNELQKRKKGNTSTKTKIKVRDARHAAVLKVRYIPLAEDAALRRAVCFDVAEVYIFIINFFLSLILTSCFSLYLILLHTLIPHNRTASSQSSSLPSHLDQHRY